MSNWYDELVGRYARVMGDLHASQFDAAGRPRPILGSAAERAGEQVRRALQPAMSASQFGTLAEELQVIRDAMRRVRIEEPADKTSRDWMIWNAKLDNLEEQFAEVERQVRSAASLATGKTDPAAEFLSGADDESLQATIAGDVYPAPRAPGPYVSAGADWSKRSKEARRDYIRSRQDRLSGPPQDGGAPEDALAAMIRMRRERAAQPHPLAHAELAKQIEDAVRGGGPQFANGGLESSQFAFGRPEVQALLRDPNAQAALLTLAKNYGVADTENLAQSVVSAIQRQQLADTARVNVRYRTGDDSTPIGQASAAGRALDAEGAIESRPPEQRWLAEALASGRVYANDLQYPLVPYVPVVVHTGPNVSMTPAINPVTGKPKIGADGNPIPAVDPRTLPAPGTPDYNNMMAGLYRPAGVQSNPQPGVFAALEVPDGSGGFTLQPQMDKPLIPLSQPRTGSDGNRSPEAMVWLLPQEDGRFQAIAIDPQTGTAASPSLLSQDDVDRLLMAGYQAPPAFGFRSPLIAGKDPAVAGRRLFEMGRSSPFTPPPSPESLRNALAGYELWEKLGTTDDLRQVVEAAGGPEVIEALRAQLNAVDDPASVALGMADTVRNAATQGPAPGASQFVIPPSNRRMPQIVASAGANASSPSTMAADVTSGAATTSATVEPPTYGASRLAVTPQGYSITAAPDGSTAPITVDAGGVIGVGGINPSGGSVVGDLSMAGLGESAPLPPPDVNILDALLSTRRPTAVPQMAFTVPPDSWAAGVMGGQAADAQRVLDSLGGPIDVGAGAAGRPFLRQFDPLVGMGIGETAADVSAGVRRARRLGIDGLTRRLNSLLEMRGEPLETLRDQAATLSRSIDARTGGLLSQQEQLRVRAQELRDEIEYRKQPVYDGPVWDAGRQEMTWPQDSGPTQLDADLEEISRLHGELRDVTARHRALGDQIRSMTDQEGVTVADDMAMLDSVNARIRDIESSPERYERLTAEINDLYGQLRSRKAGRSQRREAKLEERRAANNPAGDVPAAEDPASRWTADVDEADANATRMAIAGAAGQEPGKAPVSFSTLRGWFNKAQKAKGAGSVRYPVGLSLPDGRAADGRPGSAQVGSLKDEFTRLSAEDAALQEQLDEVQLQLHDAKLSVKRARRSGDEQGEAAASELMSTLNARQSEIQAKMAENEEAVSAISARVAGDSQYESGSAGSNQARLIAKFMGPAPRKGSSREFVRNDLSASREAMRELLGTDYATPLVVVDDIVAQAVAEGVKISRADVVYSMLMRDPSVADAFSRDAVYSAAQKAVRELEVEFEPTRPAPTPQNTTVVQKSFYDRLRDFSESLPLYPKDPVPAGAPDASPLDELHRTLPNAETIRNLGQAQNIFVDLSRMHASDVATNTPSTAGAFGAMSDQRARQTLAQLSNLAGDTSLWPAELAAVKGMLPDASVVDGMDSEAVKATLADVANAVSSEAAQSAIRSLPTSGARQAMARIDEVVSAANRFVGPGYGPVPLDVTANVRAAAELAKQEVSAAIRPSGVGDVAPAYANDVQKELADVESQLQAAYAADQNSKDVQDLLSKREELERLLPAASQEGRAALERDKPTPYNPQPEQLGPTRRDTAARDVGKRPSKLQLEARRQLQEIDAQIAEAVRGGYQSMASDEFKELTKRRAKVAAIVLRDTTGSPAGDLERASESLAGPVDAAVSLAGRPNVQPALRSDPGDRAWIAGTGMPIISDSLAQDPTRPLLGDLLASRDEIAARAKATTPGPTPEKVAWNYGSSPPGHTVLVDGPQGKEFAEAIEKVDDITHFRMRTLGKGKVVIEGGKLLPTSTLGKPEFQTIVSVTGDAADLNTRDPQKYAVTMNAVDGRLTPAISEPDAGARFIDRRGQGYEDPASLIVPSRATQQAPQPAVPEQPAAQPEYRYDDGMDYEDAVEGYGARTAREPAPEPMGLEDPVPGPGRAAAEAEYDDSIAAQIQRAAENRALRVTAGKDAAPPESVRSGAVDDPALRDKGSGAPAPVDDTPAGKSLSRKAGEKVRGAAKLVKKAILPAGVAYVVSNLQESGIVPSDDEMAAFLMGSQAMAGEPGMGSGAPSRPQLAAVADTNTDRTGVLDRVRAARRIPFYTSQNFLPR